MANILVDTIGRFMLFSPEKRATIVFVISTLIFSYGWLVLSARPIDEVTFRGIAFGLAFTIGYYISAKRD